MMFNLHLTIFEVEISKHVVERHSALRWRVKRDEGPDHNVISRFGPGEKCLKKKKGVIFSWGSVLTQSLVKFREKRVSKLVMMLDKNFCGHSGERESSWHSKLLVAVS